MQPAVLFGLLLEILCFFSSVTQRSPSSEHAFVYLMAYGVQLFSLPAHILDSYHHVVLFFLVLFYKFLLHH